MPGRWGIPRLSFARPPTPARPHKEGGSAPSRRLLTRSLTALNERGYNLPLHPRCLPKNSSVRVQASVALGAS